jgi:hypothetical protein
VTEFAPTVAQQRAVADYLATAVIDDLTGLADGDRCVGEPPSARYYLASLAPADLDLAAGAARRGRETPSALGFEFEFGDSPCELRIDASASVYYRVFPTLEEQLDFTESREETPADRVGREYRLAPVFQRRPIAIGPLSVQIPTGAAVIQQVARDEFATEFAHASRAAADDRAVERRDGDERRERFVPGEALNDPDAFAKWLADLRGAPVIPAWAAAITVVVRPSAPGRRRVIVVLDNLSTEPTVTVQGRGRNAGSRRHDDARDHFLFRARLEVAADRDVIVPIRMDLGPDAYRYDPDLAAYANNCGVSADRDAAGRIIRITSEPAPVHETVRAETVDHPSCRFATLAAADPLPALRRLAADLDAYPDDPAWTDPPLPAGLAEQRERDRQAARLEAGRFRDGLRWLARDERLLLAFRLANAAFARAARDATGPGWRLFQLVFIVSELPALAWREHPSAEFTPGLWGGPDDGRDPTGAATVVFYPTSGGKTEAYLGLIVANLFYDRARGKGRGVTAWCRFPLRLLTLQQTQRHLDIIVAAEHVLDHHAGDLEAVGGLRGDPFTVAFLAGEGNTPNSLSRDPAVVDRLRRDPNARRRVRIVDTCPYCGARAVDVVPPDPTELRLVHRCGACQRDLPVLVVDTEIYRYLPGVVVGTLDKLANIGLSDRFGALLGDVDCECPVHGLGRGGKCHERRSPDHPSSPVVPLERPLYDPSPTLEVVDELHLVDEELGAFSGHYEGLLAATQLALTARARPDRRGVRMKVVATTATIRGEDRQCDHLFGLPSVVVPRPGPTRYGSFYWRLRPDLPMRTFVGVMPARATAEMTIVRILTAAHRAIRLLQARQVVPAALAAMPPADLDALIDVYRTSVTYSTSKVDHGKTRRSLDTQVNQSLSADGHAPVVVAELTGDTPFDQVRATLDDLTGGGRIEAVTATSMVSHGVDVDRLNLMVFNGMPRSMAEYIQASSRVGRRWLGLVFMIFNPIRERDRSHFRYHGKFHEYLDRMVEPVAINRWSRFAADRTVPGVLMGQLLQVANREWWDAGNAPTHLHDLSRMQRAMRAPSAGGIPEAQPAAVLAALRLAYQADRAEAAELSPTLDQMVNDALDSVRTAGAAGGPAGRTRYRATGDYLNLAYDPMLSLRDVAEGIPFFTLPERRRP